jgi:hypothetical protein
MWEILGHSKRNNDLGVISRVITVQAVKRACDIVNDGYKKINKAMYIAYALLLIEEL